MFSQLCLYFAIVLLYNCGESMSGKVRIDVLISKEVAERLYEYVKKTNLRIYGGLSRTVEEAIREFLERHAGDE